MNDLILVFSYFIVWSIILFLPSYLLTKVPNDYFNPRSFLFKEKKWKFKGKLYERVFFIKRWKAFLPDGAKIFKNGFEKKHLKTFSIDYLENFVIESCRAELAHLLPILLSLTFALYNPPKIVLTMFLFGVFINLPCIVTQRYNRIRINKILNKLKK